MDVFYPFSAIGGIVFAPFIIVGATYLYATFTDTGVNLIVACSTNFFHFMHPNDELRGWFGAASGKPVPLK